MRHCPYCAEEIRDAAVVCRFCGRDVAPTVRARGTTTPPRARALYPLEVGIGLVAFAAVAYLVVTQVAMLPAAGLVRSPVESPWLLDALRVDPPPRVLPVMDSSFVLMPGEHLDTTFTVTDPRPCRLTGRVRAVAGGDRDVEVYVLDEEAFDQWHEGIAPYALYRSGRSSSATLDLPLPSPGIYSVLVSNRWALMTQKLVRVEELAVTCDDP